MASPFVGVKDDTVLRSLVEFYEAWVIINALFILAIMSFFYILNKWQGERSLNQYKNEKISRRTQERLGE